jgi:AraC-like DNA-binding protein
MSKSKTVSAIAVIDLAHEMLVRGLLTDAQLKAFSAEVYAEYQCFKQGDSIVERRLPEVYLVSLWNLVNSQSDFAFEVGCTVNEKSKGLLANWISYSDTLDQAFSIFTQNIALLNHAEYWLLQKDISSENVVLEFQYNSDLHYGALAIERSMVAVMTWANYLTNKKIGILSATFSYAKPKHHKKYQSLFGICLEFNTKANKIVLKKSDFHQPLGSANAYLRDVLQERSEQVQLSLKGGTSTAAKIKQLLLGDLTAYSNIEHCLTALHMSRATVYRKLKEECTTFTELVKQARLEALNKLNADNKSADEMALLLGFADVSSYYRLLKQQG